MTDKENEIVDEPNPEVKVEEKIVSYIEEKDGIPYITLNDFKYLWIDPHVFICIIFSAKILVFLLQTKLFQYLWKGYDKKIINTLSNPQYSITQKGIHATKRELSHYGQLRPLLYRHVNLLE